MTHHILIAGGGIGGMAAALALINRGHDVDVYEQAPELKEFGAGVQISGASGEPEAFAARIPSGRPKPCSSIGTSRPIRSNDVRGVRVQPAASEARNLSSNQIASPCRRG